MLAGAALNPRAALIARPPPLLHAAASPNAGSLGGGLTQIPTPDWVRLKVCSL